MQTLSTDENGEIKNRKINHRQILATVPIIIGATILSLFSSAGSAAAYNGNIGPIKIEQQSTPTQPGQEFKQDPYCGPYRNPRDKSFRDPWGNPWQGSFQNPYNNSCCKCTPEYVDCRPYRKFFDSSTCRWVFQDCCYDTICHKWVIVTRR
jgi:hypothetical protein